MIVFRCTGACRRGSCECREYDRIPIEKAPAVPADEDDE